MGPRLAPPVDPVSTRISADIVYNNFLVPAHLPPQSVEANAVDNGRVQEKPGRGIRQVATSIALGWNLNASANVCNDFNGLPSWASTAVSKNLVAASRTDLLTDWYAGWGPFAINDGYYQAKNVAFSMEQSVGPGSSFGPNQQSLKIHADHQPYAAGVGSPLIPIPDGYQGGSVQVTVKYLIWDHDEGGSFASAGPDGMDYDWASMGVKADAFANSAVYVNGYVRGQWAEMTNVVPLVTGAHNVMVLLQAQSPGNFNSNIYFDDVSIAFIKADGTAAYVQNCKLAVQ